MGCVEFITVRVYCSTSQKTSLLLSSLLSLITLSVLHFFSSILFSSSLLLRDVIATFSVCESSLFYLYSFAAYRVYHCHSQWRNNLLFYSTQSLTPTYSALLYSTLLFSTLLYSTLLFSTLLYSTLLYSTLLYSALLYSTLLYSTLLYSSILYSPLLYSTLLSSTLLFGTLLYVSLLYSTELSFSQSIL